MEPSKIFIKMKSVLGCKGYDCATVYRYGRADIVKADYMHRMLSLAKKGGTVVECGVGEGRGLAILIALCVDLNAIRKRYLRV